MYLSMSFVRRGSFIGTLSIVERKAVDHHCCHFCRRSLLPGCAHRGTIVERRFTLRNDRNALFTASSCIDARMTLDATTSSFLPYRSVPAQCMAQRGSSGFVGARGFPDLDSLLFALP